MELLVSPSHNPYENLALEQELLNRHQEVLYLWVNQPCVVFGFSQNPYLEVNLDYARKKGILVCRRSSGGGAVYQDEGNLNYTWISGQPGPEELIALVGQVLQQFGITIEKSGRNDLLTAGRKFSGLAYERTEGLTLYHGTMMVAVDTEPLSQVLHPSRIKLASKGIRSVSSRVINLQELNPELTVDRIIKAFEEVLHQSAVLAEPDDKTRTLAEKYASADWIYGQSPPYDITLEKRFPDGLYTFSFLVEAGKITDVQIYTDSLHPGDLEKMKQQLLGRSFQRSILDEVSQED